MLAEFVPLLYYPISEHFLPVSFLNLNLSSWKPFVRVFTFSLTMRTLFMSRLSKILIHLIKRWLNNPPELGIYRPYRVNGRAQPLLPRSCHEPGSNSTELPGPLDSHQPSCDHCIVRGRREALNKLQHYYSEWSETCHSLMLPNKLIFPVFVQ